MMTKLVHVAVGIVFNKNKEILIAKRPEASHQGGLWEFPGGKVEEGETVFTALVREFREEVGIEIQMAEPYLKIEHQYSDKNVMLDVWRSRQFEGIACGLEGQEIKWISLNDLNNFQFPKANQQIINKLLL